MDRLGRALQQWVDDPQRQAKNLRLVEHDRRGWQVAAVLTAAVLILKVWLQEGMPGLALACSGCMLNMAGIALLAARSPGVYARNREALITLALLGNSLATHTLAARGGTNHFVHHRGSALLLLLTLAATHYASWTCIYVLYGRLDLRWAVLVLPLVALLPRLLIPSGGSCAKLVAAAGAGAALEDLHTVLSLLHSPLLGPTGAVVGTLRGAQHGDDRGAAVGMQQCRTIDLWVLGMVGYVVPLCALRLMDRPAQRAAAAAPAAQRQQQRRQAAEQAEQAEQAGGRWAENMHDIVGAEGQAETDAFWLRVAYFASCGIWAAASLRAA